MTMGNEISRPSDSGPTSQDPFLSYQRSVISQVVDTEGPDAPIDRELMQQLQAAQQEELRLATFRLPSPYIASSGHPATTQIEAPSSAKSEPQETSQPDNKKNTP